MSKPILLNQQKCRRFSIHTIEEVFSQCDARITCHQRAKVNRIPFGGTMTNLQSDRLKTFKVKGLKCCACGIEGKFFALEIHEHGSGEFPHLNLYGINADGNEVLMTKDHIVPKSKGGRNSLKNYQTMCFPCNYTKGGK